MLSTSFRAKMLKLYFGQNLLLVQFLIELLYFFSCKRFFQLCLGLLNMLSTSFCAKPSKLYFGQNSWPVGPRGIFEQILIGFFLPFQKFFQ